MNREEGGEHTREPLRAARSQLLLDALGIAASAAGFGVVFGLAAREAGYSLIEGTAMSVLAFAGAAQFAAVGFVRSGMPWPAIFVLTALLNARHLLYSAALRPWLTGVSTLKRAVMAHLLTDEAFALSISHFRRLGRADLRGYWLAAIGATFIPWNLATIVGMLGAQAIPDPSRLGLDVVFPAAMAGLTVGLVTGRRELVAAAAAVAVAIVTALVIDTRIAALAGGLIGPLAGLAAPGPLPDHIQPDNPAPMGRGTAHPALQEAAGTADPAGRAEAAGSAEDVGSAGTEDGRSEAIE
jgi:predicted branched-subunit amino acid permease